MHAPPAMVRNVMGETLNAMSLNRNAMAEPARTRCGTGTVDVAKHGRCPMFAPRTTASFNLPLNSVQHVLFWTYSAYGSRSNYGPRGPDVVTAPHG